MRVNIILGSERDLEVGEKAVDVLDDLEIDYEITIS